MASRGSGASKGRGTTRPGSRSSSARPESAARSTSSPKSKSTSKTANKTSAAKAKPAFRPNPARADKARPTSRPAATRAPRVMASARQDQGSGLWRWAVIAIVALVLVVLLAPTMRSYFAQRSEIAALERQVAQGEERLAQLEAEQERWRDPAYIEQQARERLKFVRPGEVSYTVIGGDEIEGQQVATGQVSESRPWYDRLVASINQADRTDVEPAP